jgi:hypothetical protein
MLGSTVSTFTDPCAYQDAVGSAQGEVLITATDDFRADLTRIDLHKLSLQIGRETLPRVGQRAIKTGRTAIYFLVGTDQAAGVHCGAEVSPDEIIVNAAGATYHPATSAHSHWADVSLTSEDLAARLALAGCQLVPARADE